MSGSFAEVILPIPVRERFTYRIPEGADREVVPFMRVIVPLGKHKQSLALVTAIHSAPPSLLNVKEILSLPDEQPVIHPINFELWKWISRYYLCPEGDVMKAAIPAALQPEKSHPKMQSMVYLHPEVNTAEKWDEMLAKLNRATKQKELLLQFAGSFNPFYPGLQDGIAKNRLLKEGGFGLPLLQQLVDKKILLVCKVPASVDLIKEENEPFDFTLTNPQQVAFDQINQLFRENKAVLFQGINGSGKTLVYLRCIQELPETGKQILILVPETVHVPHFRNLLVRLVGKQLKVYHSGMNETEKAETWNSVFRFNESKSSENQIILGTRSAIFLPFSKLGLIIADDEHDGSYKQADPSPRYHARDMAVLLGTQHHCPVLMGSATPAFDSLHNAATGKYGLVLLGERYGGNQLPEIIVADLARARKRREMHAILTPELYASVKEALRAGEQTILIQNRRGYASFLQCAGCGHTPVCPDCNVNLTSHLSQGRLVCHYCGYKTILPEVCPACGSDGLKSRGLGTEKVETEIAALFPNAGISRLDGDTAPTRLSRSRIIRKMENKETDILVGTQMAAKGLNAVDIRLAGILTADTILSIPDFRSLEKAYQLFQQIIGRLIREDEPGKIIIQTTHPELPFYQFLGNQDYTGFFQDHSAERKIFRYPPWFRLIRITLKHRNNGQVENASATMASELRNLPFIHVLGPEAPFSGKQKGWYVREIWIKSPRKTQTLSLQEIIPETTARIKKIPGNSSLNVTIDVDPG